MSKNTYPIFGKKTDNTYKIIERKYKNDKVRFFVEVTNTISVTSFDAKFPEVYIHHKPYKTYEKALKCVAKLKEKDKKVTVLDEKIHTV